MRSDKTFQQRHTTPTSDPHKLAQRTEVVAHQEVSVWPPAFISTDSHTQAQTGRGVWFTSVSLRLINAAADKKKKKKRDLTVLKGKIQTSHGRSQEHSLAFECTNWWCDISLGG